VARLIEKLGMGAIILHEQVSQDKTIIEKIEENTNVGYAVVLYTPCDLGKAKDDTDLKKRARQNVIFEHGYLIGKLGRERVSALVKGDIEKPNDISGVVYIDMDNGGGWKVSLAREMKSVGYE
jgi:predicted nucleotide-binding protein